MKSNIVQNMTADDIRNGDHLRRGELSARIFANQSQSDIAARMSLPIEVIAEYESRFFDVRALRDDKSRVWREIIDWHPDAALDPHDLPRFWLLVAHQYGLSALESFLSRSSSAIVKKEGILGYITKEPKLLGDKLVAARACSLRLRTVEGMDAVQREAELSDLWLEEIDPYVKPEWVAFVRIAYLLHGENLISHRRDMEYESRLEWSGR